jgi:hypothetical protein
MHGEERVVVTGNEVHVFDGDTDVTAIAADDAGEVSDGVA